MGGARLVVERSEVTSGDATLVADVCRMDDHEPRPCLLQRVPYGRTVPGIVNGALDVRRAVAAGFVVVVQDCRGRGESSGEFVPFRDEQRDALATFDWIIGQPWSDGSIGTFGRSYAGLNQWLAASAGHPSLRAIAPTISGGDPAEWLWPDNVFEWGFALWWVARHLAPGLAVQAPTGEAQVAFDRLARLAADERELFRVSPAHLRELCRDTVAFLADWADGELPPDMPRCRGPIGVPAFVTAGWFDIFARSTLETWRRSAVHPDSRLVIGPWAHGGTFAGVFPDWDAGQSASDAAIDLTGQQLRWFRAVLGGSAPADDPGVQAFICGAGRWERFEQWPVPHATPRVLVAAESAGTLRLVDEAAAETAPGWQRPLPVDAADPFPTRGGPTFLPGMEVAALAGPRAQGPLLDRSDVLVVESDPRTAPQCVVGEVWADLVLHAGGPSHPDDLVCVRLCDRSPGGTVFVVSEGAAPVPAGAGVHHVRVRVGPCAWGFEPGHAVVVAVTRASWPRFRPPAGGPPMDVSSVRLHLPAPSPPRVSPQH